MGKLEIVRSLFEYNEWANDRLVDAAAQVSEDELTKERGVDFGSLQGILLLVVDGRPIYEIKNFSVRVTDPGA